MAEIPEGMSEGATLEGIPVFSSFSRSSISGWTIAIGIPKSALLQRVERSVRERDAEGFGLRAVHTSVPEEAHVHAGGG